MQGIPVKTARFLVAGLIAALAAGCAQPPVPQDHFYRIQVAPPANVLATPRLPGTLEVSNLMADGLTGGRPIVYSDAGTPLEVNEYHYHFWTEPPPSMLRDQLVSYLRDAGLAKTVVTPDLRLEPDFAITGRIRQLEQVRGASPRVVVSIELALRALREERLLLVKTYRVESPSSGDSVSAAVDAFNAALGTLYGQFLADVPEG